MSAAGVAGASIGFRRCALHVGGLWALAFAQPLLDLLGRNPEFFVARGSTRGDILLLAFGYVLVPPLAAAAVVAALGRIRPVAGWAAHLALVAVLTAALAAPPLGDLLGGSALALGAAAAAGGAAAALYARAPAARAFLTALSPAPLVVLVLFLGLSPVRELLRPEAAPVGGGPATSSTPIVHVVLDELPESTIDAGNGRIDAALFPNLARLAAGATWYRNATTVDELTADAVPAQLTGENPEAGSVPTVRGHPRNLFTLFARSHDVIGVEPITDLCPAALCPEPRAGWRDRLASLRSDLTIVAAHLLLPDDLRAGLPAIDGDWQDFAGARDDAPGPNPRREVLARLAADDAEAGFRRAIAALRRPRDRPPLVFVHSTLPHGPWRHLPDGRRYPLRGAPYPGLDGQVWTRERSVVDQEFQRHVLQARDADRLVGTLLDALRAHGLYDRAVIVVAADHGVSFRPGGPRRRVTPANVADIAAVPFLVKWPGQRRGRVDDRAVRTVDVLPTIADAAGVRVPWRTDGMPVARRRVDPAAPIAISHAGTHVLTEPLGAVLAKRRARERAEAALLRDGPYAIGPAPRLIGRRVPGGAARGPGRATVEAAADYAAVDPVAPELPAQVAGTVEGVPAGTILAVAAGGRVAATTRAEPDGDRLAFRAVLPPSALVRGANAIAVLQVLRGDRLRRLGGTGGA